MYKKQFKNSVMIKFGVIILSIFMLSNISFGMDDIEMDKIIAKMDKATDPEGISKTIKTSVQKVLIEIPANKINMIVTVTEKFPNKSKTVSEIPSILTMTRIFDGNSAWEHSGITGLREITGKELSSIKFQAQMKDSNKNMRDLFSKIEVADGLEKVGDFDCYKFTCTPNKEYEAEPVIMFIDNKEFLMRKMKFTANSQMGAINTESIFSDYKLMNKLMVAKLTTMKQAGATTVIQVLDITNNVPIDDSEFDKDNIQ